MQLAAIMASLDSVKQKLYRAKHHDLELEKELREYYAASETVQIQSADGGFTVGNVGSMPTRFGLIAGDMLQCMRSSLDYLVWELVLANGQQPPSILKILRALRFILGSTYFAASSISFISASDSEISAAFRFSSRCATDDVPGIGSMTGLRCSSHARVSCDTATP
jgi:hypothetical protein